MKKPLIIIAVIAVIGLVAWAVLGSSDSQNDSTATQTPTTTDTQEQTTDTSTTQPTNTESNTPSTTTAAAKITYTSSGFQASSTTVKAGETVEIINQSSEPLQFASDPHPAHTENTELNIGIINPGETKQFKPTTKGTWGYHNHLDSSHKGQLTVQ